MTDTVTKPKAKPTGIKPKPDDGLTQSERFMKAARELGTDDDPERFKDRVRGLVKRFPEAQHQGREETKPRSRED